MTIIKNEASLRLYRERVAAYGIDLIAAVLSRPGELPVTNYKYQDDGAILYEVEQVDGLGRTVWAQAETPFLAKLEWCKLASEGQI